MPLSWTAADLVPIGYFAKRPARRPSWIHAPGVEWICSVCDCDCAAASPPDWIPRWLHNELWVFDTLAALDCVIPAADRDAFVRYGLRALPIQFGDAGESALPVVGVRPEPIPPHWQVLGYDVCNRSGGTLLECSPLSCNDRAASAAANRWCLLDSLPQALVVAERFAAEGGAEPGPYVVLEVWAERLPAEFAGGAGIMQR